jgi:thiamine pyrophosphate-dependent acetolactate synthase large subunit-like protein
VHFLNKADLVFAIGSSCTKEIFTTPIPEGKRIIQSTVDERDINKDYPVEQAIIGDAKLVLRQLIDEIKEQLGPAGCKKDHSVAKEIKAVKDEWLQEWLPKLTSNEVPINPYRVVWDMMQALDRNDHYSRLRQFPESVNSLLGIDCAGQLHRLGKINPAGCLAGLCHGGKISQTGKNLCGFHG